MLKILGKVLATSFLWAAIAITVMTTGDQATAFLFMIYTGVTVWYLARLIRGID